jgi:hypothetical protein
MPVIWHLRGLNRRSMSLSCDCLGVLNGQRSIWLLSIFHQITSWVNLWISNRMSLVQILVSTRPYRKIARFTRLQISCPRFRLVRSATQSWLTRFISRVCGRFYPLYSDNRLSRLHVPKIIDLLMASLSWDLSQSHLSTIVYFLTTVAYWRIIKPL